MSHLQNKLENHSSALTVTCTVHVDKKSVVFFLKCPSSSYDASIWPTGEQRGQNEGRAVQGRSDNIVSHLLE